MSLPDPRPLSEIPDDELSPKVLSSPVRYFFWASLYTAIHLGLCYYLFVVPPPVFTPEYNRAVAALVLGPFFYFPDIYLRQIWWPYRREMRRRGGVPPMSLRLHPYDFEIKIIGLPGFFSAGLGLIAYIVFVHFDTSADNRAWFGMQFMTVTGVPALLLGGYHSYCIGQGKQHV